MIIISRVRVTGLLVAIIAVSASGYGFARMSSSSGPARRASADAAALLDSFQPPPGATRESGKPSGTPGQLNRPMIMVNTPNLVTKTRWWTIPGTPDSVMSWETAHPPKGMTFGGNGSEPSGLMVTFQAPPIPAVLPSRQLLVQAAGTAGDRTVIRVDAQDTWLPAQPASEAIPPAAVLTIRATYPSRPPLSPPVSPGSHARPAPTPPAVMTITDRAVIARAANLVAALPVTGPGVRHCPAAFGGSLNLTFASPDGAALAKVGASASGCGMVSVVVHGTSQPSLSGGPELIGQLGSLLHVRWPGMS